jgi:hypothetical protein
MTMVPLIAALLLAATTATLAAQDRTPDPLDSAECRAAQDELEAALNDPPSNRRAQRLENARKRAAQICLGPTAGRRDRSGAPYPARVVPAPVISGVPAAPLPPVAAPPAPALAIPRAAAITVCDPGGCWDSEGRRLNSTGPLLMGPRGLCSVQGGVVTCP